MIKASCAYVRESIATLRYIGCSLGLLVLLCVSPQQAVAQQAALTSEAVGFTSAGVALVGTIFRPEHPSAAVVIVHGAGQEKRMAGIASLLARNGIAALTYDKRGVGESGGVYAGPEVGTNNVDASNLALLAGDASAAVSALSARFPSDQGPIGLLGFSQAGWIVPMAAKKNRTVRFMVLFSGPVVTTREQLRFQFFTQGRPDFWDTHTEAEARKHISDDPDRYQFVDTDPRDALTKLSIPGLWVFGGRDVQAPVRLSIERLDALKVEGKPFEYRLFPTLGHNVAFSDASEPVDVAVQWIKSIATEAPQRNGGQH